jgi:hypothetical protein
MLRMVAEEVAALVEGDGMGERRWRMALSFTPGCGDQVVDDAQAELGLDEDGTRATRRSACSATVPAREFSIGMTAAWAEPFSTRSNTSAERAQGMTWQRGSICSAASWLKDPRSPWMAALVGIIFLLILAR